MDADRAAELGAPVRARILAYASCGVDPSIMGIGPVPAVHKVLERAGRTLDEVGVIELNEAFAAQALAVMRDLDLDPAKVNPNGGAIALGHPIAATGALITAKCLAEMERGDHELGLVTLCIGGGQGIASCWAILTSLVRLTPPGGPDGQEPNPAAPFGAMHPRSMAMLTQARCWRGLTPGAPPVYCPAAMSDADEGT